MVSRRIESRSASERLSKEPQKIGQQVGQPDTHKAAVFGRSWFLASLNVSRSSGRLARAGYLGRSQDASKDWGPLHIVSAWASEQGISLGQVATDDKSNEITAIPELLTRLDLSHSIVTIDAIGCQKAIAQQIVAEKGHFVIAVKDNQPKLLQAIRDFFCDHLELDRPYKMSWTTRPCTSVKR